MALNIDKQELLEVLVAKGGLSDRAIAKEVGCDPKTVRNYIEKLNLEKSSLSSLAKEDITNTIKGNEIEAKKSSLNPHQRKAYDKLFITMSEGINLFNNSAIENQLLVINAQEEIKKQIESEEEKHKDTTALDHLPNLLGISKITESNRKQLLGQTETYKKPEGDGPIDNKWTVEIKEAVHE